MSKQVTYSYARQNFAEILDEAEDSQEPVIITRRDHADVALIPAAELQSLQETAHLLRSPRNAQRLLAALQRALQGSVEPQSVPELKAEVGLE
jgi:antitoxin YefM